MSTAPQPRPLTDDEYLAIERAAEFQSELLDGEMIPRHWNPETGIGGAEIAHNIIKENLVCELGARFKGGPFWTLSSSQRVKIAPAEAFTYPDVLVGSGRGLFAEDDRDTLTDPTAIIEILSPSTEDRDRGKKFRVYMRLPSLREYVLVAQDEPRIERFVRQADGSWVLTVFEGLGAEFALTTGPARVPMADVYRGVEFRPGPPPGPTG